MSGICSDTVLSAIKWIISNQGLEIGKVQRLERNARRVASYWQLEVVDV